jgi:hypothetical protein
LTNIKDITARIATEIFGTEPTNDAITASIVISDEMVLLRIGGLKRIFSKVRFFLSRCFDRTPIRQHMDFTKWNLDARRAEGSFVRLDRTQHFFFFC